MKIYTKKGDKGTTQLFGGARVPKHHLRVECYGAIDELNSYVGLLLANELDTETVDYLKHLQILLFDMGSHLATDPSAEKAKEYLPKVEDAELTQIETLIDKIQAELPELKHFIMPSGSQAIAHAHLCRTVCRRTERLVTHLNEIEQTHSLILPILNRLSDYFFVLARHIAKAEQVEEIKWEPRKK